MHEGPSVRGRSAEERHDRNALERHGLDESLGLLRQRSAEIGVGRSRDPRLRTGQPRNDGVVAIDHRHDPAGRRPLLLQDLLQLVGADRDGDVEQRAAVAIHRHLHGRRRNVGDPPDGEIGDDRPVGDEREAARLAGRPRWNRCIERHGRVDDLALGIREHHPTAHAARGALRLLVEALELAAVEIGRVRQEARDDLALADLAIDDQRQGARRLAHRLLDGGALALVLQEDAPDTRGDHRHEHRDHEEDEPAADGQRHEPTPRRARAHAMDADCRGEAGGKLGGEMRTRKDIAGTAGSLRPDRYRVNAGHLRQLESLPVSGCVDAEPERVPPPRTIRRTPRPSQAA